MDRPIPDCAWSWPIGQGYEPAPRPRVSTPMLDDGPWAGAPIGGMGAGSLGRTQRGDFARRHLVIGEHRFESSPWDGFSVWASDGTAQARAVVLRTTPPPPGWGPGLHEGDGVYRALFPRAWFEFGLRDWPIRVTEEQLAPMIPGDEAAASLPVGLFEYRISNPGRRAVEVALLLSWRDELRATFGGQASVAGVFRADGAAGMELRGPGPDGPASFAIAAARDPGVEIETSCFDAEAAADRWARFVAEGRLGVAGCDGAGDQVVAVTARCELASGESRSLRFAVGWDLPAARFGSGRQWPQRYTREWGTGGKRAADIAAHALDRHAAWRAAIEAWQQPIVASSHRPDWYKAALFNELYYLLDGGTIWPAGPADPPVAAGPTAELAVLECYDYPFYDTLDVHFYAAFALSALWPRLQASISRAYAATVVLDDPSQVTIEASGEQAVRKVRGALPHDLGGPAEDPLVRVNHYRFQAINEWKDLNPKFVLQAWRDRALAGDPAAFIREVWPSIGPAMDHVAAFDRDGDGLPEHDGRPDQTYDTWPMAGPSAYGGSLWLAALRAAAAFAREAGDDQRAAAWDADFARGRQSFDRRLWNGRSYDYDAGGGRTSDSVMADQLVGQWYADASGLGDLVAPDRIRSSLEQVFALNVRGFGDGCMGAVNGMRPDGAVDTSSEQSQEVWAGTTYALAAFMIGRGMVEEGWATAEGAARMTWERGLWFRTPEAYDVDGNFRASLYLRPLAIWAIEEALVRVRDR